MTIFKYLLEIGRYPRLCFTRHNDWGISSIGLGILFIMTIEVIFNRIFLNFHSSVGFINEIKKAISRHKTFSVKIAKIP